MRETCGNVGTCLYAQRGPIETVVTERANKRTRAHITEADPEHCVCVEVNARR